MLKGVEITVGEGGSAGLVRLRASDRAVDPERGVVVGDWFMLPAEPGRYLFPAPRLVVDYRSVVLTLDQQTGNHAIVDQAECRPALPRYDDSCQLVSLDAWTPFLPDSAAGLPPELGGTPEPSSRQPGQRLQFALDLEADKDGDLAGDVTEDRTDLAVTADAVRGSDGKADDHRRQPRPAHGRPAARRGRPRPAESRLGARLPPAETAAVRDDVGRRHQLRTAACWRRGLLHRHAADDRRRQSDLRDRRLRGRRPDARGQRRRWSRRGSRRRRR